MLGTAHSPEVQAQSWTSSQGYTVVWLDSGLIEFCYQAAKAVIATLHPVTVSGTRVSFEFTDQHIRDELDRNPEPVERLYRTLEAYFFGDGYPRAPGFSQEAVPAAQVIPLTILVDMMERWVLAHEYGHGFATGWGFKNRANETEDVSPARAEEYFADSNATILTVMSAAKVDHVDPAISLSGPAFALACLEVKRRGLSVARCGKVLDSSGDGEHPPNKLRAANVLRTFDQFFDMGPQNGPGTDLTFVLRPPDEKPVIFGGQQKPSRGSVPLVERAVHDLGQGSAAIAAGLRKREASKFHMATPTESVLIAREVHWVSAKGIFTAKSNSTPRFVDFGMSAPAFQV